MLFRPLTGLAHHIHLGPHPAPVPDVPKIHGRIPDVPLIPRDQPPPVIGGRRVGQGVADHDVPGAAQQAELYVAHQADGKVDVLRHEKHAGLVVDLLPQALVGKCHQQCPCAAGRVSNRYPALPLNLRGDILTVQRRHGAAHVVGCKKLSVVLVAEAERHENFAKQVLIGVFVQRRYDHAKHLTHGLHLCLCVFLAQRQVGFFSLLAVHPVNRVGNRAGAHDDPVCPHLPPTMPAAEALEGFDRLFLGCSTNQPGVRPHVSFLLPDHPVRLCRRGLLSASAKKSLPLGVARSTRLLPLFPLCESFQSCAVKIPYA